MLAMTHGIIGEVYGKLIALTLGRCRSCNEVETFSMSLLIFPYIYGKSAGSIKSFCNLNSLL